MILGEAGLWIMFGTLIVFYGWVFMIAFGQVLADQKALIDYYRDKANNE